MEQYWLHTSQVYGKGKLLPVERYFNVVFFSYYRHVIWSDFRVGFGLDIVFIEHFNTWLVAISNYSATANLQSTTAPAKYFPACSGLHQPFPGNGF
jgi:hypothetical protein